VFSTNSSSDLLPLLSSLGQSGFGGLGSSQASNDVLGGMSSSFELLMMQALLRVLDRLEKLPAVQNNVSQASTAQSNTTLPSSLTGSTSAPLSFSALANTPAVTPPYSSVQQAYQPNAAAGSSSAATAVDPASVSGPLPLADYPHPPQDNGRGMHWIPTISSTPEVVDRYVADLKAMHIKWTTFLNDGTNIGANDYLVQQLKANGIEPVMRVYTSNVEPLNNDDLGAMVRHYKALGVSYFQLYNEPNVTAENNGQAPDVNRYLDCWIPAAKVVTDNGGLPGFGALSPGGEFKDTDFLSQALDGLRARGQTGLLDKAWLDIHNYQGDRPVADTDGFARFKVYDDIVKQKLGRDLPEIGTEGGSFVSGSASEADRTARVTAAYQYMQNREPYNFAYSYWNVANEAGGGHDPAWESQALFQQGGQSALVDALTRLQ
jgi:hypothetical protein